MFKNLLTTALVVLTCAISFGQVTVLDFETPATSAFFQYFGSDLDMTPNEIVANPAPDAVNGSAMVGNHVKPANAFDFAGAFSLDMPNEVDVTTMAEVCIKVHMPVVGTFLLKLEESSTGGDNWEKLMSNTTANVWEEICFDVTQPSDAAPNLPAFGNSYSIATIFFEFLTVLDEERTYFFDDLVVRQGNAAAEGDVTFTVDMSDFPDAFSEVAVFGTFNSFDPVANPLTDNGDGTWSGTVAGIPTGGHEYLFLVDGNAEAFSPNSVCTNTTGDFTNRTLVVTGDTDLPAVCFNSCFACGEGATFTINVGTSNINVSPDGIFIAGGGNFGAPGDNPLNDDDGDGIYSITLERSINFSSFFTFTNGACPDFSCKENIEGQDCADPNNFNDRFVDLAAGDVELNTCFAICTETNDNCGMVAAPGNITFQVDMNSFGGSFTEVFIFGQFNNFDPVANPLTDDDGDGIWETTVALAPGPNEYKFLAGDVEEVLVAGTDCTITTPDGIFTNRLIEVSGDETVCFVFETCNSCFVGTNDLTVEENLFSIAPTVTSDISTVSFSADFTGDKSIRVFNVMGQMVYNNTLAITETQHQIDVANFADGIYMVHVQVGNLISTKKIMKN